MIILTEKLKREIKELINTIEYCHTLLATLRPLRAGLIADKDAYQPEEREKLLFEDTMKIAELEFLLRKSRNRLHELGIY